MKNANNLGYERYTWSAPNWRLPTSANIVLPRAPGAASIPFVPLLVREPVQPGLSRALPCVSPSAGMADVELPDKPDKELLDAPQHRFDDDEDEDEILPAEQESAEPPENVQEKSDDAVHSQQHTMSTQQPERNRPDSTAAPDDDVVVDNNGPPFTRRFEAIIEDNATGASEAKEWLDRVLIDGPRAVADVLAIVVSPAVVRVSADAVVELLNQRTVMANDPARSVRELCEALEGTSRSAEGILVTSRKHRGHYQNFWTRIVTDSSDAILYDTDCFDTLLTWLEAMSTAKLSIMRHAACIATYSIVDGLIAGIVKLKAELVALQRQLKTEKNRCEKRKKKGAPVEWSDKYKRLANEVDDAAAKNGELVELADKAFTGVFVLKYRDVAAEIRVASVEFLGKWIMRYPDHYLDDTHTKYIGWLLSDKDAGVRRACLAALGEMLKEPSCLPALELFLRRFLARIVEMCHDRDNDVSVRALRVCALLVPYDILDSDATDKLCELLHEESNSAVRKAAGEFVVAFIADPDDEAAVPKKKRTVGRPRKKPTLNEGIPGLDTATELLRELVDVCVKEDAPEPDATLVLDACWEVMPSLRSWEAYATLLQDNSDDAIEDEHKALLAELLVASAKQVAAEEPAPKKTAKKGLGESCRDGLARIFTPLIPKLLVQYQGSSRILAALVQIPKYFSNVHFTEAATKKHFTQLLTRLVEAISKYTGSKEVLDAAVGTFKTMLSEGHPLNMLANASLAKASKEAAKELRVLVASGIGEQDAVAVGAAVLKARVISNLKALPEGVMDDIMTVLDTVLEKRLPVQFNTDVVTDACHVAVRQWLWDMLKAANMYGQEGGENDDEDEQEDTERKEVAEELQKTLEEMQKRLAKFAEHPYNLRVRVASAQSICSMLSVYAHMKLKIGKKDNAEDEEMKDKGDEETKDKDDVEMKDTEKEDEQQLPIAELSCTAVRECVLDVIVEQWGLPLRHPKTTSRYEDLPAKEARVPEQEVSALCTALTQVCLTSSVPQRFLHFPFLGFLLNRGQGAQPVESVCKVFLSRKLYLKQDVRGLIVDAMKCVADLSGAQRERKHQVVSLLARALMESLPKKGNSDLFSEVLKSLLQDCDGALESNADATVHLSILGKVNAFFAPRLDIDTASDLLVECRELKEKIKSSTSLDEEGRNQLGLMVFPVVQLLETISSGEEAAIPTPLKKIKIPKPTSGGKRRGRKRLSEKNFAGPKVAVSREGLRRSKRKRKPVKMDLYDESSSEEEEEEIEEEEELEDDEIMSPRTPRSKRKSKPESDEEEEEEEAEEQEDVAMRTPPRSRGKSRRKSNDEDLYGEEEEVMPTPRSRSERMSARKGAATEEEEKEEEEQEEVEESPAKPAPTRRSLRNASARKATQDKESETESKSIPRRRSTRNSSKKSSTDDDEAIGDEEMKTPKRSSRRKSRAKESSADEKEEVKATPTRTRRKSKLEQAAEEEEEEVKATPSRTRRKSKSEQAPEDEEKEDSEMKGTVTPRPRKKSGSRGSSAVDDEEAPPTLRSQKKRTRRKSSTGSAKLSVDEPLDMEDGLNFEVEEERGLIVAGVDEVEDEQVEQETKSKSAAKSKKIAKTKDKPRDAPESSKNEDFFEESASDKADGERGAPTSKETEAVEEGNDEDDDDDDPFEEAPKDKKNGPNGNGTKRRRHEDVEELPDKPVLRRKKQKRW